VSDGRRILEELQVRGIASLDLDYEVVMAELAAGSSAMSVISPLRHQASFGYRFKPGEKQLMDDLTAIARAPLLALPWPDLPAVPLERLSADLERTTGRVLQLELRWDPYPDGGFWVCDLTLDNRRVGGCGIMADLDDAEAALAAVADRVCEGWLHEEIWGGWPLCPRHPSRPMWAQQNGDGLAVWQCEADRRDEIVIGRLGL
jgi:hypothetical protein